MLTGLLRISKYIDSVNTVIGSTTYWLVIVAVIISSGNAIIRYSLNISSNFWLEIQWYLFSAIVLLCAGYTMLRNEHIRIDVLSNRLSQRGRAWLDIFGALFFLLPICLVIGVLSWPVLVESYTRHEISGDAGGLLRWPVKLLIPVGFFLLGAQGVSEIIKRIGFLAGRIPHPANRRSSDGGPAAAADESA